MVISNPAVAAVPDVLFGQQIVFAQRNVSIVLRHEKSKISVVRGCLGLMANYPREFIVF